MLCRPQIGRKTRRDPGIFSQPQREQASVSLEYVAENAKASASIPQPGSQTQQQQSFYRRPTLSCTSTLPSRLVSVRAVLVQKSLAARIFRSFGVAALFRILGGLLLPGALPVWPCLYHGRVSANELGCLPRRLSRKACGAIQSLRLYAPGLPHPIKFAFSRVSLDPFPTNGSENVQKFKLPHVHKSWVALHGCAAAPLSGQLQNRVIPNDFMHVLIEQPSFLWICQSPP